MEKVICINCGSFGYTASPRYTTCDECGGQYLVIEEEETKEINDYEEDKTLVLKI